MHGWFSPHLDPLPQGEETARIARLRAVRSGLFSAVSMVHPLPKGEGWRGERDHCTEQCEYPRCVARPMPAERYGSKPFTFQASACRRSLTDFAERASR